jgi:hypothetical protein
VRSCTGSPGTTSAALTAPPLAARSTAGVNAKALSTFLGHASISITLDRYGHLMPGSGDEAVALVDAYLERTTGAFTGAKGPQAAPLSQS